MNGSPTNDLNFTAMRVVALSSAQTATDLGILLDGSTPFSVDAWVRFDGLGSGASILSKQGVFNFGIIGDAVLFDITGYPPVQSDPQQQALEDEAWHYICATYDGSNVRLYIDGKFNFMQGISGTGASNTNPFLIGYDLEALITTVRVYNLSLDHDTVLLNMFGAPASTSIVASFDFSQMPPVDHGSGQLPIQLQNGAAMIKSTPALSLRGTAYAQPINDGDVNPGGYQIDPYTVQAWVYLQSSEQPQQVVFVNSDFESDTGMGLYLQYDPVARGYRVLSERGMNVTANILSSTALVQPNTWTNVATTFDGTSLQIYVQGNADASGLFGPIPLERNTSDLLIGSALSLGRPSGATALQGFISRVDVWNRALSATEISQYMSAVPDIGTPGLRAIYDFTASPARNQVNSHPIGLADGAEIAAQVGPAVPTPPASAAAEFDDTQLDATITQLRDSIDFTDFLLAHGDELEEAARADVRAFEGRPDDQERVRAAWRDAIDRLRTDPLSLPFLVTSHRVQDEFILLCHTKRGTHVAFRGNVATFESCLMWQVTLIFIVVAGALSAFFGLRVTLTTSARDLIQRILTNPRIAALMANRKITGSIIFLIVVQIWQLGFFRDLVILLANLGFWAILRIVAKAALTFVGVGAADVIASLAATAISFTTTYLQRPTSCDPLPNVDLASIKFNYDPTAVAVDALAIRQNYTTEVRPPEWHKGETRPEQSPVAYSIAAVNGKTITIQAKFTISDTSATSAQIRADGGGILGAIDAVTVNFRNGVSDPEYVTLSLPHHTVASGGVQRSDIQWTWFYKTGSGAWTQTGVTAHRIYVLLSTPTGPWKQSPSTSETQLPWTDVLDYACLWAQGSTTVDAASAAILQKINGGLGLQYEMSRGASKYTRWNPSTSNSEFLCTQFVSFLKTGVGLGRVVNCTDCASIATTFMNVLGCNVFASVMCEPGTGGFTLNKIMAIGFTAWGYPTFGPNFNYHEVAWTGAGSYTDPLYDACLQVDSGVNPWNWTDPSITHTAYLPVKMQFTTQEICPVLPLATPFTDLSYRERLATNNPAGIGKCEPDGPWDYTQGGRRRLF